VLDFITQRLYKVHETPSVCSPTKPLSRVRHKDFSQHSGIFAIMLLQL